MNAKETKEIIEELKKLKWNDKNLNKHTKKHPIKESEENGPLKWGNVLGFFDILKDYTRTKLAYKKESEEILKKLPDAVMYYHDDPNKSYRSIGVFEEKYIDESKARLTTFVRYEKKDGFFITTSYIRGINYKEKLYYAYELLKRPNEFKINISKERFQEIIGIPNEVDFSKPEDLIQENEKDDVYEGIMQIKTTGKIEFITSSKLLYLYNFIVSDLKEIDNKTNINNIVKKELNKLYEQKSKEKFRYIPNNQIFSIEEVYKLLNKKVKFLKFSKNIIDKKIKELYKEDNLDNIKSIFTEETANEIYKEIYNYIFEHINTETKVGDSKYFTCIQILLMVEYLKEQNKKLSKEKNKIKYELNQDEEHLFYLSLYRTLINYQPDLKNNFIDYDLNYNNEIIELLGLDK